MTPSAFWKRTWIDIDLDQLIRNYHSACALCDSTVTCVLKSNAYGLGAVRIAQALQTAGCESFAVSCAREGLELRAHGICGMILVMGLTEPELLERAAASNLTLTAASAADLANADRAAQAAGVTVKIHLKLDTGFHRLGFACTAEAADRIADTVRTLEHTDVCGLYTHLGLITRERDEMQYACLTEMHRMLTDRGLAILDVHICDSIGLVRYPAWHLSRVRAGAFLFGVRPNPKRPMPPFECKPVMAFRTTVAQVREVKAGEPIGYSDDEVLDHDAAIATLCVGYGDGYPRRMSNGRGIVMIGGKAAPVTGLVCMDQTMVDVTGIPDVQPGDTADLFGGGVPLDEYADRAETNRNECIAILSRRPVRVYHKGGRIVTVVDDLLGIREDAE